MYRLFYYLFAFLLFIIICYFLYLFNKNKIELTKNDVLLNKENNLVTTTNKNDIKNKIFDIKSKNINEDNNNKRIPKIIIQTWKTNIVPQRYMKLIKSIKDYNPDYNYLFFTDDDIDNFLKIYYPKYYDVYLKLPKIIQKIDFFRYVAIYHFGGFYLDLDMSVMKSFDSLLSKSCIFPIDEYINVNMCNMIRYKNYCDNNQEFLLGQYAFAACPKDPFIKKLIDKIEKSINNYVQYFENDSEDYIYKTTGPDFVTDVYMEYKNKNDITILDNGIRQYFGDYAKHNYFGTWK